MTDNKKTINGLILAGGFSKRLGKDKALLEFHGKPQVVYAHELLSRHCPDVYVSGREGQQYFNLPMLTDAPEFSNMGPVGGILSAMKKDPTAAWLVLACDLPYVDDETVTYLIKHRHPTSKATAYVSSHDGLPEPLCALWESHFQEDVKGLLKEGIQCPRKILIKSSVNLINLPVSRWLDNINTPSDLEGYNKETIS